MSKAERLFGLVTLLRGRRTAVTALELARTLQFPSAPSTATSPPWANSGIPIEARGRRRLPAGAAHPSAAADVRSGRSRCDCGGSAAGARGDRSGIGGGGGARRTADTGGVDRCHQTEAGSASLPHPRAGAECRPAGWARSGAPGSRRQGQARDLLCRRGGQGLRTDRLAARPDGLGRSLDGTGLVREPTGLPQFPPRPDADRLDRLDARFETSETLGIAHYFRTELGIDDIA